MLPTIPDDEAAETPGPVTIDLADGLSITFDPDDWSEWVIRDAATNAEIGRIETDGEDMLVSADIKDGYQRRGIATAVIQHLKKNYDFELLVWRNGGQEYEDGRHLSQEGAAWADALKAKGLARFISDEDEPDSGPWYDHE